MAGKVAATTEASPENQQFWWVPEYSVSVEARTHEEAVEKAKKLAKENK